MFIKKKNYDFSPADYLKGLNRKIVLKNASKNKLGIRSKTLKTSNPGIMK